ncbi:MAG: hypothetical protein GTN49_00410 [candidate division Zixibacteria bacterium]|nr:hypothetical protein [candidate division Zixibacteria bacterium]
MKFVRWLADIDRRIIFLVIAVAVVIPLLLPLGMRVKVTPQTESIYEEVENLPPGSNVLVAFDYDPAAAPEVHPMALAFLRHCFTKKHKVIIMALWPQGAQMAVSALAEVGKEYDLEYGRDYVNLGYKPGGDIVIKSLGASLGEVFPKDMAGEPTAGLAILAKVRNLKDIDLVMDLSAGDPGIPAWVRVANALYQRKVAGGCTAVSAPQFFPYLQTGQLVGLLGGLKGAAEYESVLAYAGKASRRMDAQSIAHLVIIVFIIFANISYFILRRQREEKREGPRTGPAASP